MKQLAFIITTFLLLAACSKDEPTPLPQPQPIDTVTLAGTSWVGTCNDDFLGQYPATIFWEWDFPTDSTGKIQLSVVVGAQPQNSTSVPFRYSIEGTEIITYSEAFGDEPFVLVYDNVARTLTMELYIGDENIWIGGVTVLHLKEEYRPDFPVNTNWTAEQELPSGDTLMPVHWGLNFWEYGWGGQVNYCAGSTCAGGSLFWNYDSATYSGSILINGTQHPFSYDPATDILTLEYTTQIHGTAIPIGGTLQFHRATETDSKALIHNCASHRLSVATGC